MCDVSCGFFVDVFYQVYQIEKVAFCSSIVEFFSFYHEKMLDFVNYHWDGNIILSFFSINMVYYINWFFDIKPALHSHLVLVYNPFYIFLDLIF